MTLGTSAKTKIPKLTFPEEAPTKQVGIKPSIAEQQQEWAAVVAAAQTPLLGRLISQIFWSWALVMWLSLPL